MHTGSAKHGRRWFLTITNPLLQVRQREIGVSLNKAVNYSRLTASKVDAINTIMGHRRKKRKGKTTIPAQNSASSTFFTNHLIYDSSHILVTTHQV